VNIVKAKRRVMACSCSHGKHLDEESEQAFLAFKKDFNPHLVIHLGDIMDTTAFMRSASGSDLSDDIGEDYRSGLDFLRKIEPNVVCVGNHDARPYKHLKHPSALVRKAAVDVVDEFESAVACLRAKLIPYTGSLSPDGWIKIGGVIWGHGVMFNENCARDHAESFSRYAPHVVFGHTHKRLVQPGRVMGGAVGYSIGCMCNVPNMEYAAGRRATMAWDNCFLSGEISEDDAWLQIHKVKSSELKAMPEIDLLSL